MTKSRYARLHGSFWRHDRTASLPLAAVGLHAKAMSFCADNMTDGRIRKEMAVAFNGGARPVKEIGALILAGVWVENGEHYELHDWSQHNITRESWEKHKTDVRDRVQKSRKKQVTNEPSNVTSNDNVARYTNDGNNNSLDEGRRTKDDDEESINRAHSLGSDPDHPVSKLRIGWAASYEARTTLPGALRSEKQRQLAIQLAEWIGHAGKAAGLDYDAALEKFVKAVFSSALAEQKKYRFEFVAACPEEFWKPAVQPRKALPFGAKDEAELEEIKRRNREALA